MNTQVKPASDDTAKQIALPVYQLGCGGGGALTLERRLAKTSGVLYVYVNPATEMAYVDYDPTRIDPDGLRAVIIRAGYGPPHIR